MAPAAERPDALIGSAQKVDPAKENSPAVPPGNRTHDLSIRRPAHYHWASPDPCGGCLHGLESRHFQCITISQYAIKYYESKSRKAAKLGQNHKRTGPSAIFNVYRKCNHSQFFFLSSSVPPPPPHTHTHTDTPPLHPRPAPPPPNSDILQAVRTPVNRMCIYPKCSNTPAHILQFIQRAIRDLGLSCTELQHCISDRTNHQAIEWSTPHKTVLDLDYNVVTDPSS